MAIICSSYGTTISGSNSLVCGYLIKINDIVPSYEYIEILIDNTVFTSVATGYSTLQYLNVIFTFHLVSKNIGIGTAVIDMVESSNPCNGVTCQDICVGNDLYTQRCKIDYDLNNVPIGYTCVQNTLKTANSPLCASYTDTIEISLKAYSWYTPQGAADWIVTNLVGLNGVITNFFSTITGWQYVRTDIALDGEMVLIKIRMNNLNPMSISPQGAQAIPWAFLIIVTVGTFVLLVGIPVAFVIYSWATGIISQGKRYAPDEVVALVNDNIVPSQIIQCETNFLPSNPVGYATCVKSVVCGAQNGLVDALALQKYGVDCTTLKTNSYFDVCTAQYNIDLNLANLQICVNAAAIINNPTLVNAAIQKQLEGCIIRVPFTNSCVIYDKDLIMVGIVGLVVAGGYIVYTNYTGQNKSISEKSTKK